MGAQLIPAITFRDFNNNGVPLAFGTVTSYQAGTTTPVATYTDYTQTTQNTNPVILNARGEANIWLNPSQAYKFVVQDSLGNTIRTVDQILGGLSGSGLIGINLIPTTSNAYTLGNSSFSWANIYLGPNAEPVFDSSTGNIGYIPITTAESAASVAPSNFSYPPGDIRRYGAQVLSVNNAAAINQALQVSEAGGSVTDLATGTFGYTSGISAPAGSSMTGAARSSILAPSAVDGLTFSADTSYAGSRVFRDFQLNQQGSFVNSGLIANQGVGNKVLGILFENLSINGFSNGVFMQGLWLCALRDCFLYNNYQGMHFTGLNVNVIIEGGIIQQGSATGSGTTYGVLVDVASSQQTQALMMIATDIYGYNIGIALACGFDIYIAGGSINFVTEYGLYIEAVIGGLTVRDLFIQTNNAAFATIGVNLTDLGSAVYDKQTIDNCECQCNAANSGSIGMYLGVNHLGVTCSNNALGTPGFSFATGIKVFAANAVVKNNTINASAVAIVVSSSIANVEIGPNVIQPGTPQAATMSNSSANISVPTSAAFVVGTYAQVDATQNGFTIGVDYCVLSSSAGVITLGPVGGTAIAATGSTAVNVFPQLAPVTFVGATSPGFRFNGRGKFSCQLSGLSAVVYAIASWQADGGDVTLSFPTAGVSGTSNATTMTLLGLPAYLAPVTDQTCTAVVQDSGTVQLGAAVIGAATAVITFYKSVAQAAFTGSGTKGIAAGNMSYSYC